MVNLIRLSLALLCLCESGLGVIYKLNETEYSRMPPLYDMDDYDRCLSLSKQYCIVHFNLVDGDSELLTLIREYSEHTLKHFNHTQIHRGICIKDSNYTLENKDDLTFYLEELQNEELMREYNLIASVDEIQYCIKPNEKKSVDGLDYMMAGVFLILIILNTAGTVYDHWFCDADSKSGNPYLLAFSLRRNWWKLIAPSGVGPDPRLNKLKSLNGLRTLTMLGVLFSHTCLIMGCSFLKNTYYLESSYDDVLKQLLYNGNLVTYTFFLMSSFLLAFNFMIHSEKHEISLWQIPKGIVMRWMRLTPVYAIFLGAIATWLSRIGEGPLWSDMVENESQECRQYWWTHLIYINNYIYDNAHCLPQTWYLAADTQLFCVGLLVCVLARTLRTRVFTLSFLFLLSLVIPALHMYFEDLDPLVLQNPESYRSIYANDRTFRLMYIRGHTNLSTYTLGLAGGFLVYYLHKRDVNMDKYKKYRFLVWMLFPLGVLVMISGVFFYLDGTTVPIAVKILYGITYKPMFQFLVIALFLSCVFKIESTYRGILEWRGFTWTGRVSYCAFLLHAYLQRALAGIMRDPVTMNDYYVMQIFCATIFLSYLLASLMWLCIESPMAQVTKALFEPKRRHLGNNMAASNNTLNDGQTKL